MLATYEQVLNMKEYCKIILLSGLLFFSLPVTAQEVTLNEFIDEMVTRHHFDRAQMIDWFTQAKVRKNILKLMAPPKTTGKITPWYRYRPRFVNEKRIAEGVEFWQQHASTLARAQATYGVPAEIIIAIIGVETIYGQNMGDFRVLDALTTLAFHYPRRADYFRSELEHFLLLTHEEGVDPLELRGSYAGAMGIGQFMPSSFRQYAVDFDGDGKRDIWNSMDDAIGSVAHYFNRYGWQAGQPVMMATQVRPDAIDSLLGLEFTLRYTLQQLKQQGLLFYADFIPDTTPGVLVDLETEQGMAYWVGFNNFYVITRYNRSNRYAMSVYQLAQEVADRYGQTTY